MWFVKWNGENEQSSEQMKEWAKARGMNVKNWDEKWPWGNFNSFKSSFLKMNISLSLISIINLDYQSNFFFFFFVTLLRFIKISISK